MKKTANCCEVFLILNENNYLLKNLIVFMAKNITTNYMPKKIVSGGQTGVDRGALDACQLAGFNCGGWCPNGRRAEDGIIDSKYPLVETKAQDYSTRTRYNVEKSDGTLIISPLELYGGTLLTRQFAMQINKPVNIVYPNMNTIKKSTDNIMKWIISEDVNVLNVAGPRASEWKQAYQTSFQLILHLIEQIQSTHVS